MEKILPKAPYYQIKFIKTLGKKPPNGFAMNYFLMKKVKKYQSQKVMEFPLNSG